MTTLDHATSAARVFFEQAYDFDFDVTPDGKYINGYVETKWHSYLKGYLKATSEFQKTFAGHVYVSEAEYAEITKSKREAK